MAASLKTQSIQIIGNTPETHNPEVTLVVQWVTQNFRLFIERLNTHGILQLIELHEEPPRPRVGLLVWADGSDWDPGSGAGAYFYDGAQWLSVNTTP